MARTASKLLNIELSGEFIGLGIRKQRRVMIAVHYGAGKLWDKEYLGMHFRLGAGRRYSYQHRTAKTKRRKEQLAARGKVKKGGRVDLVHSGLLEESMTRQHVIRAYPTRVVVNMPTTSYVSSRPRGNRPNMAAEITRVIPSEIARIADESARILERETKKESVDNRRKIKV